VKRRIFIHLNQQIISFSSEIIPLLYKEGPILLVGVDIIDIGRIKNAVDRVPRFLYRVFTKQELEYCFNKKNPYPSLAVRFAAKEALRKLHPAFISGIRFHEVEVIANRDGRPELLLHGRALEKFKEQGLGAVSLSTSHAEKQAIAVVIATKG